ncbi:MAG TPA: hypothetical protein VFB66_18090, partial [Tepidisphaeraceae bacterium]|nr:hypothetical protein [Tepidisphaeraceae bacterium]
MTGALLLAAGWGVPALRSSETPNSDLPRPDFREVYRPEFDKVYRLEKAQVLKRIPPPFIPEREIYYLVEHEHQARHIRTPPVYFTFHFAEEKGLRNWGLGFGNGTRTLASVLENTLGMKSYQYEGPRALLSLDLPGDWVVRPVAPESEKLVALGRIASEAHGPVAGEVQRQQGFGTLVLVALHPQRILQDGSQGPGPVAESKAPVPQPLLVGKVEREIIRRRADVPRLVLVFDEVVDLPLRDERRRDALEHLRLLQA